MGKNVNNMSHMSLLIQCKFIMISIIINLKNIFFPKWNNKRKESRQSQLLIIQLLMGKNFLINMK